ncbi:MAG: hypothetical protein R6W68_15945 [Ignavibacteriaceae bacterium]
MKKIFYSLITIAFLLTSFIVVSCDDDATPSIYEVIEPVGQLPVVMYFNFDEKTTGVPYAVTSNADNQVFVSVSGQGVKRIVKGATKDSLASFAPKGAETFFNSMTYASNSKIYATRRVRGLVEVTENSAPVTFVASGQGIEDNLNDVEFDHFKNVLWSGGNTGVIYSITLEKSVKKFYEISGNISTIKPTENHLYVALRDTNDQELVWKFPIISSDSIGTGELFFNFTQAVDTLARIIDIAVAEDGEVYIFSNVQANAVTSVRSADAFEKAFSGLIAGPAYSFGWGGDNYGYFTSVISGINSDVWRIDMKKNSAH